MGFEHFNFVDDLNYLLIWEGGEVELMEPIFFSASSLVSFSRIDGSVVCYLPIYAQFIIVLLPLQLF